MCICISVYIYIYIYIDIDTYIHNTPPRAGAAPRPGAPPGSGAPRTHVCCCLRISYVSIVMLVIVMLVC